EVVHTIVSTLVGRVQAADAERARRKPPAKLAAYDCMMRGNALRWDDPASTAEATRLFETAIEIDPNYGFAHAVLAWMRYREWIQDLGDGEGLLDQAYALAARAIALDSNESGSFTILGHVSLMRRSFDLALRHIKRGLELNPTNQWNLADM